MHRATHGAARRALRQRRSVSARIVVLAILSPALLLIGSTAADAAIVKPFGSVFSTNTNGQIILRGNTNETCASIYNNATTPSCADAQAGADANNNSYNMKYVDIDSNAATFNSSSATIDVPTGSRVLYARLSWSGTRDGADNYPNAPTPANSNQVKLQGPGATSYTTVTSSSAVDVGDTNNDAFGASADVTSYVAARGAGAYTVADIQAGLGDDRYAGWSMAIAYSNPTEPVRNLTIFNGWGTVRANQTLDIPVSGFQTPPSGSVDSRVGVAAFEGDRNLKGDQLSIDGGSGFKTLSNTLNPLNNSFNSSVTQTGVAVTGRTPGYDNTLGEDVDRFDATGYLSNNQTKATLRLSTSQDVYYPQIVTFATELYAPKLTTTKAATDVNGGNLEPQDQIEYALNVKNDGQDDAVASQITDSIPANTTYVPGSLTVDGKSVTDAADGDVGRFVTDANQGQVKANLGAGATGTAGGTVPVGATTKVTFRVTVDSDLYTDTSIPNAASTSYSGAQTGLALSTTSNTASAAVTASRADVRVRTTADRAVVQRGDPAGYTVEVVNRGPKQAEGVSVANSLPAGATISQITTDQGSCTVGTGTCDLGSLPVGATVTIRVTASVPAGAPDPTTLTSKVTTETIDPNPANDTSTASIAVNSPPTAKNTTATADGNGVATVNVLGNDNASDSDGDKLSVSKAVVEPPANGTVVINDDGTLTYTANPGFRGKDTITYTVSDGRGGTVTATLTVTVPNQGPDAKDDDTTAARTGATPIDVLANDTDPNNTPGYPGQDTLTVQSVTQPNAGTVTIAGDKKSVSFTPDKGFAGTTTFTYTISDGNGGVDTATVRVTVPNTAPEAADDDYTTPYATDKLLDVLGNDLDDNGDTLSFVRGSVTVPRSGGVAVGTATVEDGQIRFTPDDGFSGVATFDYTITDGTATSTATVTVTVGNASPVAKNGKATSDGGQVKVTIVPDLAIDPNGDPLTVTGVSDVKNGSVMLNPDGTVTYYTPTPGYKGTDSFDYTVSDGKGGTATGTITVTVNNQPPTANDVRRTIPAGAPTDIPLLSASGAKDPNGDTLTLLDVSQPDPTHGTMTFDPTTGVVTYTPKAGYDADEVLTFTVSDGDGGKVTKTLTIRGVNSPPVTMRDVTTTNATKGGSVTLDVLSNDTDPNGDKLTVCGLSTPTNGKAVVTADNQQVVYSYDDDFSGTDVFTYLACDGRGGETPGRITVTVVNAAPVASPNTATTTRNKAVTVDALDGDTDANGDALALVFVDDPRDAAGKDAGTATVEDGKVVFTPTRGFTGTATIGYHIRDARGGIADSTITVTVDNAAPTARNVSATTPYDTTVALTPDASDTDGDDLTLTVGQPASTDGTVTVVDGKAVYNPPAKFSGKVTFPYTVSDGLQTASATMTVIVGPGVTSDDKRTIASDGVPTAVTTSGPGRTTVTLAGGLLPGGLTLNPDGTFTRAPGSLSKPGTYPVTVKVCDDSAPPLCSTQDLVITVDNKAPEAGDVAVTTPYDRDRTIDVVKTPANPDGVASDPDGDSLTLTVGRPQSGGKDVGAASVVDGKVVFDPPAGFSGTVTIPYTVSDDTESSKGTITVTVGPGITSGPNRSIPAGGTPDPIITSGPGVATVTLTTGSLPGGLTLNADGTFTREPGSTSKPGSYPVTIEVCDGSTPPLCSTQDLTITVDDTAPVAGPVVTDTAYDTNLTIDVVRTDANKRGVAYDPDAADKLTVVDVSRPEDADGNVVGRARIVDGKVVFDPDARFSGVAMFTYTVTDDNTFGGPKTAQSTIKVTVANGVPTLEGQLTQVIKRGATPAALKAQDPNGDPMTVEVIDGRIPTGTTLDKKTGAFTGTATETGSYVSTVRVCDDRTPRACTEYPVKISVEDNAPKAVDDTGTTTSGTAITIPVMDNDDDPDDDPLSIVKMTKPVDKTGKVVGKAEIVDGKISYVPPVGFRGPVTLSYTVTDGTETSTATVTIDVANAAPKVTDGTDQRIATGSAPTPIVSSDPNVGDVTSVEVVDGKVPPGLTLNPDGTFSGTATTPGTYVSTVRVCDDQTPAACSTQKVTIRVAAAGSTDGTDGGPSAGGNPVQSVVNGVLPNTGSSALLPVAGLMGMVLVALGAGLALRRRREADTEPRSGPRPVGGRRRPGSRRGRRGSGLWLDARSLLPTGGPRPAAAGVTPGRHTGGRHRQ